MALLFFGLCLLIATLVGAAASVCSPGRRYGVYLAVISVLTAGGVAFGVHGSPGPANDLVLLIEAAIFAPLGIVYSVIPGLLVRRGSSTRLLWVVTFLTTVVAVPAWVFWGVYVSCTLGHDCL
jgi:hypothetical protein